MTLVSVFTDEIRQGKLRDYDEKIAELASEARKKKEAWHWTAQQTGFGPLSRMRYVSWHEDHADIEKHGDPLALFTRVFGEKKGLKHLDDVNDCLVSNERSLEVHRPELSYPQERGEGISPVTSVATLRARAGGQEALETMLRQTAEAIPKAGDDARIAAFQALTGDMLVYHLVRPLDSLADLDRQSIGRDLVIKAYGQAEGEKIFRSGLEATEQLHREILYYREDLSNPPS